MVFSIAMLNYQRIFNTHLDQELTNPEMLHGAGIFTIIYLHDWLIYVGQMLVNIAYMEHIWAILVWLVVWNIWIFPSIGTVIIPFDELICFRGVGLNHQPVMWDEDG